MHMSSDMIPILFNGFTVSQSFPANSAATLLQLHNVVIFISEDILGADYAENYFSTYFRKLSVSRMDFTESQGVNEAATDV